MSDRLTRNLVLVLGDQLNRDSAAFDGFDVDQDRVVMIESLTESSHVWSHQARIAVFLSAMRHFAAVLRAENLPLDYVAFDERHPADLADILRAQLQRLKPAKLILAETGDWRLEQSLLALSAPTGLAVEIREDRHFMMSRAEFKRWTGGKKRLIMEPFYRVMRLRYNVLMEPDANGKLQPLTGVWNLDAENRGSFGRVGPADLPPAPLLAVDAITQTVLDFVEKRFAGHPGSLGEFNWPVSRVQSLQLLQRFCREALPRFGQYQDAMWRGEPFLYHSLLSVALNLKMLDPREVIAAAIEAYESSKIQGDAISLASIEGFVRQIIGWREFIRGVYWLEMPGLREANHYGHRRPLPSWYWSGETSMNCMREVVGQTLKYGYAHHIQRLMVTGMFALLAEIDPKAVEDWYLAVYVDAVDWVELPNVAGMALFANGGRFTTKPYIASGAYISRMSNYCADCRFKPAKRTGTDACPITTLYWNFLDQHHASLAASPRTALMAASIARLPPAERLQIRAQAQEVLQGLDTL